MKITVSCCLCSDQFTVETVDPDGWKLRYDGTDIENGFCPKHAAIAEFADSQCPGCIGGWMDCSLWSAFAYSGRQRDISDKDFSILKSGLCPRRVNGTMTIGSGGIESLDLSERASVASGEALAQAIKDYCAEYPG